MDHLDAAESVVVNSTVLAADASTNITTVAATMTAFDAFTVRACLLGRTWRLNRCHLQDAAHEQACTAWRLHVAPGLQARAASHAGMHDVAQAGRPPLTALCLQGVEKAAAVSMLAVYANGSRYLLATPFTATNESGAGCLCPAPPQLQRMVLPLQLQGLAGCTGAP